MSIKPNFETSKQVEETKRLDKVLDFAKEKPWMTGLLAVLNAGVLITLMPEVLEFAGEIIPDSIEF